MGPDKKKTSILVVDDEDGIRDMVRFLLEPMGYAISCATDGLEAVEMAAKTKYDIILLDVHMPRMRGPETLEKIKQIHPSQIVIIFSSSSDPFYVFEAGAKQKGAFDCIYKPFELHDLLTVIDAARNKLEKTT